MAMLLLLPVVWLTAGDDVEAARRAAESAWSASKLVPLPSAAAMADLWRKAVDGGRSYRWRWVSEAGWVCDAEWSTRSEQRPSDKSALVNRLIAAVGGR